jgi:two-component system, response regulator FlrC
VSDAAGLHILVVDDNRSAAEAASMLLERDGHTADVCYSGEEAIRQLAAGAFDLVLTDLRMEPVDGLAVVAAARDCTPPVDAIVMTAYGSVDVAVEAMRIGAVDFLTKPVTADQLVQRIRDYRGAEDTPPALVGDSAAWSAIREQAVRLARVRSTVLVTGETGTGRRHLARWLHHNGPDRELSLVRVHPGHALTPAQLAGAGTLLLPGIDAWPLAAQRSALRQLEGLEGGQPPRVVATAGADVASAVAEGRLLPELYFRLAVLVLGLPPLRARPEDVGPLLTHFLHTAARSLGSPAPDVPSPTLAQLQRHGWPGNARELGNLAERACVMGVSALDIRPAPAPAAAGANLGDGFNLSSHMEQVERDLLERAIDETGGDRPAMSRMLGLERNTLRYKLNKYGLLDRT